MGFICSKNTWLIIVILAVINTSFARRLTTRAQVDDRRLQVAKSKESKDQPSRYRALVIGNNQYLYLSSLKTAVADAETVARVLQTSYGFEINLLRDATGDQILSALYEYRRTLDENANLLIYYAGHGHYDRVVVSRYGATASCSVRVTVTA